MGNKNNFKVENTKAEDIINLIGNLRQVDLKECLDLGSTDTVSLIDGFLFSDECYSAFINNHIMGVFGINKRNQSIWFLGNNLYSLVPKEWMKAGKYYINHFLESTPILTNKISVNNKEHIKWLRKMGAIFSIPYLIDNNYFQDFYIIKRR